MFRLKSAMKRNPTLVKYYNIAFDLRRMLRRLITRGVYMSRVYLVIDEKKVVYIVVQKVASTAIKASMTGMEAGGMDNRAFNKMMRGTRFVLSALDPAKHKDYFVFTFVRNPFERLISCYENKYHTDKAIRDEGKYDSYLLGYISKDKGFKHFARRVCRIPDRISDFHFVSQSFLIDRMVQNPKPDFVGHFERLTAEYEPIRERFDFSPLPHYNKTPKQSMWMDYYDLPTARKVYKRYRRDIERYGYQQTYRQLIEYLERKEQAPGPRDVK